MKPIFLIFTALLLTPLAALQAEAPDPGQYSAEQFEVKATRGNKAMMRDGVRLSVDVFQPKADGRFPAILIITPYGNNPGYQKRGTWFAQRGYVVAVADSRGRFDSEGEFQHGAFPSVSEPGLHGKTVFAWVEIGEIPHIFL